MELFSDSMQQAFDASIKHVDDANFLPSILYTSPEFYEFEKQAIFDREWLCVGRVAQLPGEGDWMQITLMGEPLLVVHGKGNQFHVLSAVCQHRGMVVAEGTGNSARFVCPYHHWCYAHDGSLIAAPEMDEARRFEKAQHGLPSLPVEIWNGFIFATFNPAPKPLASTVSQLTELLANFKLDDCHTVIDEVFEDLPWNWKVMLENFNDGYHANALHEGIADHMPSNKSVYPDLSPDEGHVTRINYANIKDPSFTPNRICVLPVFKNLTDDERHRVIFALLPPSLGLAITPDNVTYFIVNPKSADKIDIHIGYCVDSSGPQDPMFEYQMTALKDGVQNFNRQDIWVDTMVQQGLHSRFQPGGRYSWQEKTLQQFNCWLVKRYRAAWPQ